MIKGKTSGGFEFEIDSSVLEDMEFVDALAHNANGKLIRGQFRPKN